MGRIDKEEGKKKDSKPKDAKKTNKISKTGLAMKSGIGKDIIVALTEDPWNQKK